jgi:hypothetical protein
VVVVLETQVVAIAILKQKNRLSDDDCCKEPYPK